MSRALRSAVLVSLVATMAASAPRAATAAPTYKITTVAGNGTPGSGGDGGPASVASLALPKGLVLAPDGGYYFINSGNSTVRRVAADGTISTIAGNGTLAGSTGPAGDGGPATSAQFRGPDDLGVLSDGSILVSDQQRDEIRRFTIGGTISTVAGGTGVHDFFGDGGPATAAGLQSPAGIAVLPDDSYLFAQAGRIRKVSPTGIITTVAGSDGGGFGGDGGPATAAKLSGPLDVSLANDGGFFIADTYNLRIRRVTPGGVISTVAGTGEQGDAGDGGSATAAKLSLPVRVVQAPSGDVLIADQNNHKIRQVSGGIIRTVAGTGEAGGAGDGGLAVDAQLFLPFGIAVQSDGDLLIADNYNNRIREVDLADGPPTPAAPNTTISSGPPAATQATDALFAFTSDPSTGASFKCWVDSAAPATCSSPQSYTGLTEGPHTFRVEATVDGVADPTPAERGVFVDTKVPATTVTAAPAPAFGYATADGIVGTAALTVAATDPAPSSGAVTTRCVLDPPTVPTTYSEIPASPGCPPTLIFAGVHKAYAASIDAAGNTSTVASTTFTIIGSPDTTITKAPAGPITTAPTFEFIANVAGATFECAVDGIDGSSFKVCASPLTLPQYADGEYLLRVRAIVGGVRDPVSAAANFRIDTVAPAVTVGIAPGAGGARVGARFTGPVDLSVVATDPDPASGIASVRCVRDVGFGYEATKFSDIPSDTSCSSTIDGVGFHAVFAAAIDKAGNTSSVVYREFTILPVPDTSFTQGASGEVWSTGQTFGFASTVPGSTFRCSVDGAAFMDCSAKLMVGSLKTGNHSVQVFSTSPDGVADPTPARRDFSIGAKRTTVTDCVISPYKLGTQRAPDNVHVCSFSTTEATFGNDKCWGIDFKCVITPQCPLGARCTGTTTARWFDDDAKAGWDVRVNGYVTDGPWLPDTSRHCNPGLDGDGCVTTQTLEFLGRTDRRGSPTLAQIASLCSAKELGFSARGSDAERRLECSFALTVEPAAPLSFTAGGRDVTLIVPESGTIRIAPSTAAKVQRSSRGAARSALAPKPLFTTTSTKVAAAGSVTLTPKLTKAALRTLKRKRKLAVKLAVTFTPDSGGPVLRSTLKVTLTTVKKLPKKCRKSDDLCRTQQAAQKLTP